MNKIFIIVILISGLYLPLASVYSAGLLPRFRSAVKTKTSATGGSGITVSARLSPDRKALHVYFNQLNKAKSVIYTLTYQTEGKEEGVSGSIDLSTGNSTNRELLFGTCSSGVCRYHTNISNMRLEVASELASGKTQIKRFRVRI